MFKSPLNQALTAIVAAIAVGAAGAPAMAETGPTQTMLYPQQKDGVTVYCAKTPARTGTYINSKVCKTRSQWAEEGVVIPEGKRAADTKKQKSSEG